VFSYDDRWRLEGKLLAGCVGPCREGADALLLSRLVGRQGRLRVRVSNLAPEVEYIDQVQLGSIPLQEGEELDMASDGCPVVWKLIRQLDCSQHAFRADRVEWLADLGQAAAGQVLILEVRNTAAFETAMRASLLIQAAEPPKAALEVRFDSAQAVLVQPPGTKFSRRVIVTVPPKSRTVRLCAPRDWWLVRRLWLGTGQTAAESITWQSPVEVRGSIPEAHRLLLYADRQRVQLEPMQDMELLFAEPAPAGRLSRWGHVLRMTGYYEFVGERAPVCRLENKRECFPGRFSGSAASFLWLGTARGIPPRRAGGNTGHRAQGIGVRL